MSDGASQPVRTGRRSGNARPTSVTRARSVRREATKARRTSGSRTARCQNSRKSSCQVLSRRDSSAPTAASAPVRSPVARSAVLDDLDPSGGLLLHQGEEQLVLAAEVGVDGALGEAGGRGDLIEGRGGEAPLGEDRAGRLEDPAAHLVLARARDPRRCGRDRTPGACACSWSTSILVGIEYRQVSRSDMTAHHGAHEATGRRAASPGSPAGPPPWSSASCCSSSASCSATSAPSTPRRRARSRWPSSRPAGAPAGTAASAAARLDGLPGASPGRARRRRRGRRPRPCSPTARSTACWSSAPTAPDRLLVAGAEGGAVSSALDRGAHPGRGRPAAHAHDHRRVPAGCGRRPRAVRLLPRRRLGRRRLPGRRDHRGERRARGRSPARAAPSGWARSPCTPSSPVSAARSSPGPCSASSPATCSRSPAFGALLVFAVGAFTMAPAGLDRPGRHRAGDPAVRDPRQPQRRRGLSGAAAAAVLGGDRPLAAAGSRHRRRPRHRATSAARAAGRACLVLAAYALVGLVATLAGSGRRRQRSSGSPV